MDHMYFARTGIFSLIVALLTGTAAAGNTQPPIETGFTDILNLSADLYQVLEAKDRERMNPKPVLLDQENTPCLLSRETVEGNAKRPAVQVSNGMVDLLNYVSFVKAIQKLNKGYYNSAIQTLAKASPNQALPALTPVTCPAKNQLDVSNEQMGYFNQLAGTLLSIELAHHTLGYYAKYQDKLTGTMGLNHLLTPKEWHKSMVLGANKAIECGLGVDGLRALLEMIDSMPARPDWTEYILPKDVKAGKIIKLLKAIEDKKLSVTEADDE